MLSGYPNANTQPDGYVGVLAQLLLRYPRSVALACADPLEGVARETKFLPTPADIGGWCDRRVNSLYEEAAHDSRVESQLRARDEWLNAPLSQSLVQKTAAWLKREDPVAKRLTGATDVETAELERKKRVQADQEMARNSDEIEREWAADGKNAPRVAGLPVSKELALIIKGDQDDAA